MRVKKLVLFLQILLLITSYTYSSSAVKIQYKQGLEVVNGHAYEGVYCIDENQNDLKLSWLDWEIANIPSINFALGVTIIDYIQVDCNALVGLPGSSGHMQDYDWLNITNGTNELTNYSIHENRLQSFYQLFLKIGGNIRASNGINFNPYFCIGQEFISFDGVNGHSQYGKKISGIRMPWNSVDEDGNPQYTYTEYSEKVISYQQNLYYYGFGFNISYNIFSNLKSNIGMEFFPVTDLLSIDTHHLRSVQFADQISRACSVKIFQECTYKINDLFTIGCSGWLLLTPETKGSTYYRNYYESEYYTSSSSWSEIDYEKGSAERILYSLGIYFQLNF